MVVTLSQLYLKISNLHDESWLGEIEELDVTSRKVMEESLKNIQCRNIPATELIDAVLDYIYERINIGDWKEVKPYLRKTMTIGTYCKLLAYINDPEKTSEVTVEFLKTWFKIIDHGLMFGCPLEKAPKLLQECASVLCEKCSYLLSADKEILSDNYCESDINIENINGIKLELVSCPSMESFYNDYILKEKPVVLDHCMTQWPALEKWKDQNYFLNLARFRTVPVELGTKYTDQDWTQKLMTLEEFIKKYIFGMHEQKGYLAQYQLFEHIPELKDDIKEPEYCCFSETDDPVDINAWFGPKGTVSPLHTDPKKNLLAQVVGSKKIFLFSPSDSEYLYPHEEKLLHNTAKVDPLQPNLDLYPNYVKAKLYYCILKPGQMLYIPPKWWHFVESLSISFSVSFWWD